MNIITIFHNKAMEFADEALLAKMEGNNKASEVLFEKAFSLEKEAATSVETEEKDNDSRYILIRSAASLALNCGKYQEARMLIETGLQGNPPDFIVEELHALEKSLDEVFSQKISQVEFIRCDYLHQC